MDLILISPGLSRPSPPCVRLPPLTYLSLESSMWDTKQLQNWLEGHKVEPPMFYCNPKDHLQNPVTENWRPYTARTVDHYSNTRRSLQNLKGSTFETWNESRPREFLLEQWIVEPTGPRGRLILLARGHYNAYMNAGYSLSSTVANVSFRQVPSMS